MGQKHSKKDRVAEGGEKEKEIMHSELITKRKGLLYSREERRSRKYTSWYHFCVQRTNYGIQYIVYISHTATTY